MLARKIRRDTPKPNKGDGDLEGWATNRYSGSRWLVPYLHRELEIENTFMSFMHVYYLQMARKNSSLVQVNNMVEL
jgi:hypothetical protein